MQVITVTKENRLPWTLLVNLVKKLHLPFLSFWSSSLCTFFPTEKEKYLPSTSVSLLFILFKSTLGWRRNTFRCCIGMDRLRHFFSSSFFPFYFTTDWEESLYIDRTCYKRRMVGKNRKGHRIEKVQVKGEQLLIQSHTDICLPSVHPFCFFLQLNLR